MSFETSSIPSWDFGAILNFASSTVESTGDFVLDRYFYFKYPNNIPIYLIYVGMIEFLNSGASIVLWTHLS